MFSKNSVAFAIILLLMTALTAPAPADASAARSVTVKLPSFPVTVDGRQIDIPGLKYPPIVYKGITYFPLTYNVGKGMGLLTTYTKEKGLYVYSSASYKRKLNMETGGNYQPGQSYKASIVNFPVHVGEVGIDNAKEPYPLLLFHDITYFPLTWRFAVEDFRWMTSWDDKSGLAIRTWQQPYFDTVIYDDQEFLYAPWNYNGRDLLKIRKDLQGVPERIGGGHAKRIWDASEKRHRSRYPAATENYKWQEGKLMYEGAELLSAETYERKIEEIARSNPSVSDGKQLDIQMQTVKLNEDTDIVHARVYYVLDIPAPYTPHEDLTFMVRGGAAQAVPEFTQSIDGHAAASGGIWIWSAAPRDVTGSMKGERGLVTWIGGEGKPVSFNRLMNAQQLQYLSMQGEDMLVRAYTLSGNKETTEGFFRLRADGTYEKLADFPGPPLRGDGTREYPPTEGYADADGNLYLIGPNAEMKMNGLMNIKTGEHAEWWDHALWEAVGKPAW